MTMLRLIERLFTELNQSHVRFCHWKSNAALNEAVAGVGDLDLLIDPSGWPTFRRVLRALGFVEATLPPGQGNPTAHHYYGLDVQSGLLVHLDVYDRLVTGGQLLKNHHLPLEEMLLQNLRYEGIVPVPSRGAELLLLALRKLIESASLPEHALLLREYPQVLNELRWLDLREARAEALQLSRTWLPEVGPRLITRCIEALACRGAALERARLGRRLNRALRVYEVRPSLHAAVERWSRLGRWTLRRARIGPRGFGIRGGGMIVAFVGAEASGKSTLVAATAGWLGNTFATRTMHVGKPPAGALTLLPNLLAPCARALWPGFRTGQVEADRVTRAPTQRSLGFWLYLVRCLAVAYDRHRLLRHAGCLKARGAIVVCDRYPSTELGFVDSPQLDPNAPTISSSPLAARLAALEGRLYAGMPRPDVVIAARVPLEQALERNVTRRKVGGPEPPTYVRRRHAQFERWIEEQGVPTIDTAQSSEDTLLCAKRLLWSALTARSEPLTVTWLEAASAAAATAHLEAPA